MHGVFAEAVGPGVHRVPKPGFILRHLGVVELAWSHSPHHGGRAGRAGGAGSSAGDSRAASTAYEFRTPVMLPPVKPANLWGVQPEVSAVATAGASLVCRAGKLAG